jgi:hypothetical protein
MGFKVTAAATRAGWMPATGDALRAVGNALGAMMLSPTAPEFKGRAGSLFRIRVGKRVSTLEKRIHLTPTGRCSRGRWETLDSGPTPANARGWGKLAEFWAWYAAEISEGHTPEYCWTDDPGKGYNARTRAHANRLAPSGGGGPGRGRKGKRQPSRLDVFGHAPASGPRVAQTAADARAAKRNRDRVNRKMRESSPRRGRFVRKTGTDRTWVG